MHDMRGWFVFQHASNVCRILSLIKIHDYGLDHSTTLHAFDIICARLRLDVRKHLNTHHARHAYSVHCSADAEATILL